MDFFVYLGDFLHFNETVERSTLTHWFDLLPKGKVLNPKFYIQWGIMQA